MHLESDLRDLQRRLATFEKLETDLDNLLVLEGNDNYSVTTRYLNITRTATTENALLQQRFNYLEIKSFINFGETH